MKKGMLLMALLLAMALVMTGCFCEHEWKDADCVNPKTCELCEKTDGAPLGHSWIAATCTTAKTCEVCGATDGEAKGHDWAEATCTTAKTCKTCNITEGEIPGHAWEEATTDAPKTCTTCQLTEGTKLEVDSRFTTAATKQLHGKWTAEAELSGDLLGTTGYLDKIPCVFYYDFGNAGAVTMQVEFKDMDAFLAALKKMTMDATYQEFAGMGLNKEAADQAMQTAYGMSMEQYVDAYLAQMDMKTLLAAFSQEKVYYVEGDKIYMADSWLSVFSSSKFTLENGILVIEEDALGANGEPLQWTRVTE